MLQALHGNSRVLKWVHQSLTHDENGGLTLRRCCKQLSSTMCHVPGVRQSQNKKSSTIFIMCQALMHPLQHPAVSCRAWCSILGTLALRSCCKQLSSTMCRVPGVPQS